MASLPVCQIFLSSNPSAALPPALRALSASVQHWAGPAYQLHNHESLRQFLHDHYDSELLQAFDRLRPYAYRADLGRYALLFQQGGWYFDIGTRLQTPLQFRPEIELVLFREQLLAGN